MRIKRYIILTVISLLLTSCVPIIELLEQQHFRLKPEPFTETQLRLDGYYYNDWGKNLDVVLDSSGNYVTKEFWYRKIFFLNHNGIILKSLTIKMNEDEDYEYEDKYNNKT